MNALKAAIKREARGEPIRWQASPRPRLSRLFSFTKSKIPLRRPTFVLTDSRLFSLEELSGEYVVRSALIGHVKDLIAKPSEITNGNPNNREVRLLQDLKLYCPTTSMNAFKRALDRIR